MMGRSDEEISRGCEEIGYKKGTKEHKECVDSVKRYEKSHEEAEEKRQREESEEKWRNRK